jgi:propanol-preferring alcohol dehydrogenase
MKAVQCRVEGGLVVHDVDVPTPGPGQVLVKVAGAGLCHSDCMIMHSGPATYGGGKGFTIGHETAGWVEAVGVGVTNVSLGQPVVVHAEYGCGQCPTCMTGNERYCPVIKPAGGAGLGFDGGLAELIVAPARAIVALPEPLDPVDAGPLDDAGLTPYHAIRTSMPWLEAGTVTTVIGIGGLGHLALQILRALSSTTIVAVEKDPGRRAFALELGADLALDPEDDAAGQIKSLSAQKGNHDGSSLVLDLVGADATLALGAASAGRQGKLVCVGAALGSIPFGLIYTPWECTLTSTYSGEAWELEQLLRLAAAGKVVVSSTHITLDDVPEAYERLDRGEHGEGRLIAIP